MDDGLDAELRALRARAYAPGADIDADPAALHRLAELEALRRSARTRSPGPMRGDDPDATPTARLVDAGPALTDPEPPRPDSGISAGTEIAADTTAAQATGRASRRPSVRTALTWAGSLVAVAVLAAAVTNFATARTASTATAIPDDAPVTHLTTLLPTGGEQPGFLREWGADDARSFEPFFGLRTYEVRAPWHEHEQTCLLLMNEEHADEATDGGWGSYGQGCSAGAFPAAMSFVVTEEYPAELREHFPNGSALQFVLSDVGVDVFLSDAPAQAAG
ncbi:hypothetical protein [Microbacterium thalli]|uniref:Uncharacterized protein n=1 Tax=Microbacterium thalli TaxID=3027921 RepID=A0ABT5SK31_9MICO|nr:hypothetical protein [Microbacterium thalli]MDD7927992.1 hypothetical protein [Microbacterium thalli]MDD7963165.1 hypothetical protein [Microbacterium thalli]